MMTLNDHFYITPEAEILEPDWKQIIAASGDIDDFDREDFNW